MNKIIKKDKSNSVINFEVSNFASANKSDRIFGLKPFPEGEVSVQDASFRHIKNELKSANFKNAEHENADSEDVIESQKKMLEENADYIALKKKEEEQEQHITAVTSEKESLAAKIKELEAELPLKTEEARKEGYAQAVKDLEDRDIKQYEAQKSDYLNMLERNWAAASEEIKKIQDMINSLDEHLPQIVIEYVKQIVGKERILNDKFINSVISVALEDIKDLQKLTFTVNPEDASIVKEKYPQYSVVEDPSIPKGDVKIRTKVGEINISVDAWVKNLEDQINEQLTKTKND